MLIVAAIEQPAFNSTSNYDRIQLEVGCRRLGKYLIMINNNVWTSFPNTMASSLASSSLRNLTRISLKSRPGKSVVPCSRNTSSSSVTFRQFPTHTTSAIRPSRNTPFSRRNPSLSMYYIYFITSSFNSHRQPAQCSSKPKRTRTKTPSNSSQESL